MLRFLTSGSDEAKEMLKADGISGMDLEYNQRYEVFAFYDTPQGCFQIKVETENMPTNEEKNHLFETDPECRT